MEMCSGTPCFLPTAFTHEGPQCTPKFYETWLTLPLQVSSDLEVMSMTRGARMPYIHMAPLPVWIVYVRPAWPTCLVHCFAVVKQSIRLQPAVGFVAVSGLSGDQASGIHVGQHLSGKNRSSKCRRSESQLPGLWTVSLKSVRQHFESCSQALFFRLPKWKHPPDSLVLCCFHPYVDGHPSFLCNILCPLWK